MQLTLAFPPLKEQQSAYPVLQDIFNLNTLVCFLAIRYTRTIVNKRCSNADCSGEEDEMINSKDGFAERLNTLLELKRKPDGSKYSQEEIVQKTKGVLSRAYLWKLRTGRAKNPGFHIVQALADCFSVDIHYFTAEKAVGIGMIDQAREDELVTQITVRASMLGREGKLALLSMIEYILKNKEGAGASQDA